MKPMKPRLILALKSLLGCIIFYGFHLFVTFGSEIFEKNIVRLIEGINGDASDKAYAVWAFSEKVINFRLYFTIIYFIIGIAIFLTIIYKSLKKAEIAGNK